MSTEARSQLLASTKKAHALFAGLVLVTAIIFSKTLIILFNAALQNESSSHILLIPVVTCYLLIVERNRIFAFVRPSALPGSALILLGMVLYFAAAKRWDAHDADFLSAATFSIVVLWIGAFLFCYGLQAWRRAAFPLLFLLLMVPLPPVVLDQTIYLLQRGSTEITCALLKGLGVPVFRQGFVLTIPGLSIEVAKECSGIRSSMALFVTCLLAAHLFLRTKWKMTLFVLLAFPLAIVKNGIRIATLTLLSVYVDRGFLTGNLHREGGFVFFLLALCLLAPVLFWLQKSEKETRKETAVA